LNKKIVSFRIEPFFQEAIIQIIADVVIVSLGFVLFICAGFPFDVDLAKELDKK
jgi:hypothetical protein